MKLEVSKVEFINYTLMYLLIGISGMPFITGDIPMVGAFGLAFLIFFLRKESLHRSYIFFLFAFLFLVLLHALRFNNLPTSTIIGLIIRLSTGYLVVAILKEKFAHYYVNILYVLAIFSLFFFSLLVISPGLATVFNSIALKPILGTGERGTLIIYHLNLDPVNGIFRNCGPFWEPAAFTVYLMIGLMFNLALTNSLSNKRSIIFIVTIITTLSTTAYVTLGLLIFSYFLINQKAIVKIAIVPVMLLGFYFAFFQLDFLSEKIQEEIEMGNIYERVKTVNETVGHSRLSSAIADYDDFMEYPIIGRGIYELNFYDPRDLFARHNGLTRHIAQFGIIGSLIYFISLYMSLRKVVKWSDLKKLLTLVFFCEILLLAISEVIFHMPFFWGLTLLHLGYKNMQEQSDEIHIEEQTAYAQA